jgi:Sas10 C-terminal domain
LPSTHDTPPQHPYQLKSAKFDVAPRIAGELQVELEAERLRRSGGRRGASYEIIKNRGLTPHRNKLARNPRVKKREAYRKAVIRRKGQVRDVSVSIKVEVEVEVACYACAPLRQEARGLSQGRHSPQGECGPHVQPCSQLRLCDAFF